MIVTYGVNKFRTLRGAALWHVSKFQIVNSYCSLESDFSKNGFGRHGVVYFYGFLLFESVGVTGVEASQVCAKFSQAHFELCILEPLLNPHFLNHHLRAPDRVPELFEEGPGSGDCQPYAKG